MDRFTYNYLTINGEEKALLLNTNRLDFVQDLGTDYVIDGEAVYDDIKTGQTSGNYKYNRIGELIEDVQEGMKLHWRYGDHKLRLIERTDQDSPEVEFFYNPLGLRVGKLVKERQNGQLEPQDTWTYYYYAYDANGQLMAVYDSKLYAANGETILEEQYIYGSDRIGVIKQGLTVYDDGAVVLGSNQYVENTLGQKRYELKNYLGTVNVTVSDRKTYDGTEDVFEAVITNYAETYPFGMLMPGRSLNASESRYLYHGMEQDVEVSGSGNSYTTEFRQYDPRLGRWKSLDPLMSKFPNVSPYNAFANNPIVFTDPNGLEPVNGDGDPPPGEGSGVEGEGGDNVVYLLPEVKAYGEKRDPKSTYKNKLNRIRGKGKWSKESKEDREAYREKVLTNASGLAMLRYAFKEKDISIGEFIFYYDNYARRGDGLNYIMSSEEHKATREEWGHGWNEFVNTMGNITAGAVFLAGGMIVIPAVAASVPTVSVYFSVGLVKRYLLTSAIKGSINATINAGVQYSLREDAGDIDIASVTIAFGSGFIPGGSARQRLKNAAFIAGLDANFDYSVNDGWDKTFSKPTSQRINEALWGAVNIGGGNTLKGTPVWGRIWGQTVIETGTQGTSYGINEALEK